MAPEGWKSSPESHWQKGPLSGYFNKEPLLLTFNQHNRQNYGNSSVSTRKAVVLFIYFSVNGLCLFIIYVVLFIMHEQWFALWFWLVISQ